MSNMTDSSSPVYQRLFRAGYDLARRDVPRMGWERAQAVPQPEDHPAWADGYRTGLEAARDDSAFLGAEW